MDSATFWGTGELWGILALVTLATYVWRASGVTVGPESSETVIVRSAARTRRRYPGNDGGEGNGYQDGGNQRDEDVQPSAGPDGAAIDDHAQ